MIPLLKKLQTTLAQAVTDAASAVKRTVELITTDWRSYDFKSLVGTAGLLASLALELEAKKDMLPAGVHELLEPLTPYVHLITIVSGFLAAVGKPLFVGKPKDEDVALGPNDI